MWFWSWFISKSNGLILIHRNRQCSWLSFLSKPVFFFWGRLSKKNNIWSQISFLFQHISINLTNMIPNITVNHTNNVLTWSRNGHRSFPRNTIFFFLLIRMQPNFKQEKVLWNRTSLLLLYFFWLILRYSFKKTNILFKIYNLAFIILKKHLFANLYSKGI